MLLTVATICGLFGRRILVLGVPGKAPRNERGRALLTYRLWNIRLPYFLELELDAAIIDRPQQIPVMVRKCIGTRVLCRKAVCKDRS
jgi:hypothetical protein